MNRSLRLLMGIGVIAILAPAMAIVFPGGVTGLVPWRSDTPTVSGPPALAAVDRSISVAETESTGRTTRETSSWRVTPLLDEVELLVEASGSMSAEKSNHSASTAGNDRSSDHDSSASSEGNVSSESQDPASTTETTSPPKSSSTSTSRQNISGTMTGRACPCTVTETVELKGDVSLQGDLTVDGGTLVARPGVNVNGNGFEIMFMNGGIADFQGSKTSTWSGDGSSANLSRDVTFRDLARIMFHSGAGPSTIKYVLVTNTGVSEKLGFYPLHWHLNGDSTRGTHVEGVVVAKSPNHAFVPHGSHGITFKDTIASDIVREAYWWDPGDSSNDIIFDHALAVGVDYPRSLGDLGLHHRMSAFYLGLGTGVVVRNSAARGTEGGADCSGFHWPEEPHGVWRFSNNATYASKCHGIFVWQNDSLPHEIHGFEGASVKHGAYSNRYKYIDLQVESVDLHALGREDANVIFDGGSIGALDIEKHNLSGGPVIFRHMSIGSVTIDNGASGGDVPGTYRFEDTDLSCEDVTFREVVPGTRVIIDGVTC